MNKIVTLFFVFVCCSTAFAGSPIRALIIDSGSDFTHSVLKPLANPNQAELNGNESKDDDNNGYIDDVFGWNFVDNTNILVELANTPPDYERVIECFRLLGILQAYGKEGMEPAEFQYLLSNYNDKKFWAWVDFAGGWSHGTHCAGIVGTDNPNVKLNAVRHIPTGQAPEKDAVEAAAFIKHALLHNNPSSRPGNNESDTSSPPKEPISIEQLEKLFAQLGESYTAKVKDEAAYLGTFKARVINCSFGSANQALLEVFKQNMIEEWGWTNPTDAEVQQVVNLFVEKALLAKDKELFSKCSSALFCIAAGNSSENLDPIVSSPNDVKIPNKLVVAATQENKKLAAFSCYGAEKVDVAVPGVNILSTIPNEQMAFMSGTSMACPMAVRFATLVLQENDKLKPVELKKILMETVDKKDWLADKVKSGGIINPERAVFAAQLMKKGKAMDAAIAQARKEVADMAIKSHGFKGPDLSDKQVRDLYFSGVF